MPDLVAAVKWLFAAFQKGDMTSVLGMLTDDISWEYEAPAELLTSGIWRSHTGVLNFFSAVASQSSDVTVDLLEYFSSDDAVAVFGRYRAIVKATGVHVDSQIAQYFKFRDGKISRLVQITNTGAMLQAIRAGNASEFPVGSGDLSGHQQNLALVQRQLDAFGRKDIDAMVENCAADCEIHSPGPEIIPYSGTMKGHAEIRAYFEKLIGTQRNANLSITQMLSQENSVIVMGSYSAQIVSTGKIIETPVALTFAINAEKISRYMALGDTAAVAAGYSQTSAAAS